MLKPIALALSVAFICAPAPALAQECNLAGAPAMTLRTPLVNGAISTPPGAQAPSGRPLAPGDGSVPCGVTPGHTGPATLLPYQNYQPGGIGQCPYNMPFDSSGQHYPGAFGPGQYVPGPASTPGSDWGMVPGPRDFCPPPVTVTHINPGGGISGWAPTQRWGGQTTTDWGLYKHQGKRAYDFGQGMYGQTSQDGPCQTRPGSIPTWDLYGERMSPVKGAGIQTIAPY